MIFKTLPLFHKVILSITKATATPRLMKMMTTSIESKRQKFKSGVYSLYRIPNVIVIDTQGVRVNEGAPYIDIVEALEDRNSPAATKKKVQMPQLSAMSHGDWSFRALVLKQEYFDSQDSLEEIILERSERDVSSACIQADKIPIRDAIQKMKVDLSCNMDYCLQNRSQLEKDFNCTIPQDLDATNKLVVRKLEQEIFYKIMCKIFGSEIADDGVEVDGHAILYEKSFMIRDFNILSFDGNGMLAAAARDKHYFVFFFDY